MTHRSERARLVATEMPHALVQRIDGALQYSKRMLPCQPVSRSVLIRHLLSESLDRLDEQREREKL